jgi:hypothetical protein
MTSGQEDGRRGPVEVRALVGEDLEQALDVYEAVAAEGRHIGGEAPIDREEMRSRWASTFLADD